MAINDIMQLNVLASLDGQDILNVFHYVVIDATHDTASDLAHGFYSDILDSIRDMQTVNLRYRSLLAFNLNDPTDFYDYRQTGAITGSVAGDYLSPFTAYSFMYVRASRLERNGAKRFAGVPEAASVDGVTLTGPYQTLANLAESALSGYVEILGTATFQPAIGHRPGPGHPGWAATKITQVSFSHIGTQNTRKIGRGR